MGPTLAAVTATELIEHDSKEKKNKNTHLSLINLNSVYVASKMSQPQPIWPEP